MVGSIAFPQYLKLVSKLGSGTFGSVYHCFDEHLQEDVAVKVYKKKVNSLREAESLNEVFLLKKLQSEYIVKFKDLFVFEDRAFLVMEYCDCNLTDYMKTFKQKTGRNLPEIKIRQIMKQALSGIQFIHSQGYMHRDIKPENFVYNEKTQEVKLIDFGTVRKASDEKGNLTSYVSTRWYRAPEQVLRSKDYGPQVDIFAMGCVMAELYNGKALFPGASELDQLHTILKILGTPTKNQWKEGYALASKRGIEFDNYEKKSMKSILPMSSPNAQELLRKMLRISAQKRPLCPELLEMEYFSEDSTKSPIVIPKENIVFMERRSDSVEPARMEKQDLEKQDHLKITRKLSNIDLQQPIQYVQPQLAPKNISRKASMNMLLPVSANDSIIPGKNIEQSYNLRRDPIKAQYDPIATRITNLSNWKPSIEQAKFFSEAREIEKPPPFRKQTKLAVNHPEAAESYYQKSSTKNQNERSVQFLPHLSKASVREEGVEKKLIRHSSVAALAKSEEERIKAQSLLRELRGIKDNPNGCLVDYLKPKQSQTDLKKFALENTAAQTEDSPAASPEPFTNRRGSDNHQSWLRDISKVVESQRYLNSNIFQQYRMTEVKKNPKKLSKIEFHDRLRKYESTMTLNSLASGKKEE